MKIVGFRELSAFPNGTLFAELREPFVYEDFRLKGASLVRTHDFWSKPLAWPLSDSEAYTRGQYIGIERELKFLVYEPADTTALIELLKEALQHE